MKQKDVNFSIVHKGAVIDGQVAAPGKIVVSGTVKGLLSADTVIISKEGEVFAKVMTDKLTVAGKCQGEVRAKEELVILKSGNCSGTVVCKNLIVEPGGILNADISYETNHENVAVKGK